MATILPIAIPLELTLQLLPSKGKTVFLFLDSGLALWLALASVQYQTRWKAKQKCGCNGTCPLLLLLENWDCHGKVPGLACWMMRNMWPKHFHCSGQQHVNHQIYEWAILDHPTTSQPASWLHMHVTSSEISQAGPDMKIHPAYWQSCDCLKPLDFGICLLAVQSKGIYTPSSGHFLLPTQNTDMMLKMEQQPLQPWGWISERQKRPSKLMSL